MEEVKNETKQIKTQVLTWSYLIRADRWKPSIRPDILQWPTKPLTRKKVRQNYIRVKKNTNMKRYMTLL